jgi:hypothetical protein
MNASPGTHKGNNRQVPLVSPQRITTTVPAITLRKLLKRSVSEGRSVSNLTAYLLEQSLEGDSEH